ncbi:hypothetical protein ABT160_27005 [Streptomyces sp. NPDC001941]|uniref:hypothetical protein n=1 Tax=Streptomyces sp. NPDC001941 TaxID=3154659 RepID=UPI003318B893
MPGPDDGRVKAYRKQAREGTLPPVLLWWVSGLDCHLVLDGHARLAAAVAEDLEPSLLHLDRALPHDELAAGFERAADFYAYELERFARLRDRHGPTVPDGTVTAGPQLARLIAGVEAGRRPTLAWPLPGGTEEWEHTVAQVTGRRRWPRG